MKIMIVDDDGPLAQLLASALGVSDVCVVPCMASALKYAEANQPDFVLLDLSLPDSDPARTMASISKLRKAPNTTVVVITGDPRGETMREALDAGADFFVQKTTVENLFKEISAISDQVGLHQDEPCADRETIEKIEQHVSLLTGIPLNLPRMTRRVLMALSPAEAMLRA